MGDHQQYLATLGLRTVQAIVADLEAAGYITRTRTGRRTRYTVNPDSPFRHPAQEGHRVGPFLALLAAPGDVAARPPRRAPARLTRPRHPAGPARPGPGKPCPGIDPALDSIASLDGAGTSSRT